MTTLKISPVKLKGTVQIPSSKSMGHREIICSGLAAGISIVDNIAISEDIKATNRCLEALGVKVSEVVSNFNNRCAFKYETGTELQVAKKEVDCNESGSTLRFFIPLGALCNSEITFTGKGKLVSRPLNAYYDIFDEQNLTYKTAAEGHLPLTINGKLKPGHYKLPGNVSSQFVSGLMFALPLLAEDSILEILPPIESESYIDLTKEALGRYGIKLELLASHKYLIPGGQSYKASGRAIVEGDWSQAAFWFVAGSLNEKITCLGLDKNSLQGDKVVADIVNRMGGKVTVPTSDEGYIVNPSATKETIIDATDCPDIIPVLTVLAAVSEGTTKIINAGRLRIKECDRLAATTSELNKLGAEVEELAEGLIVKGKPEGLQGGATVDAWNDHRIAMSLAIAATVCKEPIILTGAESVSKSYPEFWQDYLALGGVFEKV